MSTRAFFMTLAAAIAVAASLAGGVTAQTLANGCGSTKTAKYVPDNVPGAFDFTSACNYHDECYATVGLDKAGCDAAFYDLMLRYCDGAHKKLSPGWVFCRNAASTYYAAVRVKGQGAYDSAQLGNVSGIELTSLFGGSGIKATLRPRAVPALIEFTVRLAPFNAVYQVATLSTNGTSEAVLTLKPMTRGTVARIDVRVVQVGSVRGTPAANSITIRR